MQQTARIIAKQRLTVRADNDLRSTGGTFEAGGDMSTAAQTAGTAAGENALMVVPLLLAAVKAVEVGLTVYDIVDLQATLADPEATVAEKTLAAAAVALDIVPGGKLAQKLGSWVGKSGKLPKGAQAGTTVLGSYDKVTGGYVGLAKKLGANYLDIPPHIWKKMSDGERWAANQKFLDRMIARGDKVVLSTSAFKAESGTSFSKELQYLYSKGYKPARNGMSLIKP